MDYTFHAISAPEATRAFPAEHRGGRGKIKQGREIGLISAIPSLKREPRLDIYITQVHEARNSLFSEAHANSIYLLAYSEIHLE